MLKRRRFRQVAEINVVPYIDVMLVLLVIFMITAPLLFQGVDVNLPNAPAKQVPQKPLEPIVVSIDAHGNYYLNIALQPTVPIAAEDLAKRVSLELSPKPGVTQTRQVLVKGDRSVDYGRIMQAMVLLQKAGAPTVGLLTQS